MGESGARDKAQRLAFRIVRALHAYAVGWENDDADADKDRIQARYRELKRTPGPDGRINDFVTAALLAQQEFVADVLEPALAARAAAPAAGEDESMAVFRYIGGPLDGRQCLLPREFVRSAPALAWSYHFNTGRAEIVWDQLDEEKPAAAAGPLSAGLRAELVAMWRKEAEIERREAQGGPCTRAAVLEECAEDLGRAYELATPAAQPGEDEEAQAAYESWARTPHGFDTSAECWKAGYVAAARLRAPAPAAGEDEWREGVPPAGQLVVWVIPGDEEGPRMGRMKDGELAIGSWPWRVQWRPRVPLDPDTRPPGRTQRGW